MQFQPSDKSVPDVRKSHGGRERPVIVKIERRQTARDSMIIFRLIIEYLENNPPDRKPDFAVMLGVGLRLGDRGSLADLWYTFIDHKLYAIDLVDESENDPCGKVYEAVVL